MVAVKAVSPQVSPHHLTPQHRQTRRLLRTEVEEDQGVVPLRGV